MSEVRTMGPVAQGQFKDRQGVAARVREVSALRLPGNDRISAGVPF